VIYYNSDDIFEDDVKGYRIKVARNDGSGLADYMLGTESITAIAVDGLTGSGLERKAPVSTSFQPTEQPCLKITMNGTVNYSPIQLPLLQLIISPEKSGSALPKEFCQCANSQLQGKRLSIMFILSLIL